MAGLSGCCLFSGYVSEQQFGKLWACTSRTFVRKDETWQRSKIFSPTSQEVVTTAGDSPSTETQPGEPSLAESSDTSGSVDSSGCNPVWCAAREVL